MNTEINTQTLKQLQIQLHTKKISATELAMYYLNKMQISDNTQLNAFIDINTEATLAQAKQADILLSNSENHIKMPLLGLPIAHKDVFVTETWRSTAGSKMLDKYISPFNATIVQKLYDAGMVCLGKTNMDEFAMGSSNENSYYGACSNPWNTSYVPGGSSGGSAIVIAADLAPIATGSDTGGSIRQPASFCGITGIKPTYGTASRYGMIAYASSLDQAGVMGKTSQDCGLVLKEMLGIDSNDSTSVAHPDIHNINTAIVNNCNWKMGSDNQKPLSGLKIGIPTEFMGDIDTNVQKTIEQAIQKLQELGAIIIDISLPRTALSIPAYYVIASAQASSNLSRFDGVRYGHRASEYTDLTSMYKNSRSEGFGQEVKKRIMVGSYVLSQGYYDAYYLKAQKIRRLIAEDFMSAFKVCDVILGPVSPTTAWEKGKFNSNPEQMYLADIFTLGSSLAGLPCMSTPCGFSAANNMPIGMQLIAPYFKEADILHISHIYQQHTDFHMQKVINHA
jgi:aspartyl-tRNA(Asn)/glutamyl-tRNA(Gln) amidotransferase subunit A